MPKQMNSEEMKKLVRRTFTGKFPRHEDLVVHHDLTYYNETTNRWCMVAEDSKKVYSIVLEIDGYLYLRSLGNK